MSAKGIRRTDSAGQQQQQQQQQTQSAPSASTLLLCGLESRRAQLDALAQQLRTAGAATVGRCLVATESSPRSLRARARLVAASGAAVALAESRLQRSPALMELVNFAHTSGLPVALAVGQKFYEPSGALAAIGTAHGCVLDISQPGGGLWLGRLVEFLAAKAKKARPSTPGGAVDEDAPEDKQLAGAEVAVKATGSGVFLSYQPDADAAVALLAARLGAAAVRCRPDRRNRDAIEAARVFVAVMSPGYEASADSLHDLDFARMRRKEVVPVNAVPRSRKWRPSGWLALAVAGRLYHRLADAEAAAERHYDSTAMEDFVAAVQLGLQDRPTEEEAEAAEVRALTAEAEACKAELLKLGGSWPPPQEQQQQLTEAFKHLSVEDSQPKTQANLPYNMIQYSVTRMSLEPPKPLFDARGVPIARSFDAMLSYQWDAQDLVRAIREQLSVYNVDAWMDIWGGMQGNVNDSMARAVESSRMLVCFLTAKYQQSANCLLELKYAIRRDRPVLFLRVEAAVKPLDWVADLMARSVVVPFSSMADAASLDRGIPKLVRVIETIKKVSAHEALRPRRREDVSEEVYQLERLVSAAKDAIHELKGTQRFSTCSRCSAKFDPSSAAQDACAKHSAYYIGGNIMAGRWVCCSQTDKQAPGCSKAPHLLVAKREWVTITGGAKKWMPE